MLDVWEEHPSEIADADDRLTSLSDAEQARALRFRSVSSRRLFVTAWSLARRVLGELTHASPQALRFERTCALCGHPTHGKPTLVGGSWHFSISHVGDRVLLAVSDANPVGVDIEVGGRDLSDLASSVLHSSEVGGTEEDLLRVWVGKEAVLKATGHGLTIPMSSFSLAAPPWPAVSRELPRDDEYVAALAVIE